VFGAFYVIYLKCFKSDILSWDLFKSTVLESSVLNAIPILTLIILSILNWSLEIKKWQLLIQSFKCISFFEAFKQSTSSLTSSLITPNRIGEYGAKALYFKKERSKTIIGLNLIGNLSQLFWTLIFGAFGLIYLFKNYNFSISIPYKNLVLISGITIVLMISFFWIYKKLKAKISTFKITKHTLVNTFVLALGRYVVFSFQFYLILTFFKIDLSYLETFAFISSTYILASVIPAISLFDVVIKGSIAVFLFDLVEVNSILILSTVLIMWLLNFAIPAIIGSYFVLGYSSKSVLV